MKLKTKIVIVIVTTLLVMMVFPLIAVRCMSEEDMMGTWILSFFVVNPLMTMGLSILAGSDLRCLWCVPLLIAVAFPLLFCVAIAEFVPDLYVYSVMYLVGGVPTMLITHAIKRVVAKNRTRG